MTIDYNGGNMSSAPGIDYFTVTPSDTTNFTTPARSLYVGSGGTVQCVTKEGTVVPWVVPTGAYITAAVYRVNTTSTTAANIVGII